MVKSPILSNFHFQNLQKNKISSPKLTKIVSRRPQIVFRAPEGRPLAPGDRPGRSQPPSRGALGSYPGPSESFVLLKENIDFPLSAPHRRQAPQSWDTGPDSTVLGSSAPGPPYIVFSTFPPHCVATPGSPTALAPDPHAGPLRGRRTDWPAATAADPEKINLDSGRTRRHRVS